jgi:hypothetical protein
LFDPETYTHKNLVERFPWTYQIDDDYFVCWAHGDHAYLKYYKFATGTEKPIKEVFLGSFSSGELMIEAAELIVKHWNP